MSDGWWLLIIGAVLLGWSIFVDVQYDLEKRLAAWWVAQAHRRGRATGLFSFGVSAGVMLGYGLLLGVGTFLTVQLDHVAWAVCFMLPQSLAYVPFMLATMPAQTGYHSWRHELATAGATARQQRQIAWSAGPPSFIGMIAIISTAFTMVLS